MSGDDDDVGGSSGRTTHVMSWLAAVVPRRLYVGPMLNARDAKHVRDQLGVTHIVNLCPSEAWYEKELSSDVSVLHFPLPTGSDALSTLKEAKQVAFFKQLAHRVLSEIPNSPVYIHNRSGYEEEATLALIMAALLTGNGNGDEFDVERDVLDLSLRTRLLDNAEQQAIVRGALRGSAPQTQSNTLDRFVVTVKKQKVV